MPALSRETLELVTDILEKITYGAALIGAVAGILYLFLNKPLKRIEDREKRDMTLAIAKQQERAAIAETELERIKQQVTPRRLTQAQRSSLIERFKTTKGRMVIVSPMLDSEASDFADEIDAALREAGWETLRNRSWLHSGFGVSVAWLEGPAAADLQSLKNFGAFLTEIGIPTTERTFTAANAGSMSPNVQAGIPYLLIAPRPPLAIKK